MRKCCSTPFKSCSNHRQFNFKSNLIAATIFILLIIATNYLPIVNCHPVSSLHLCHGLQQGSSYTYKYDTLMLLNNHDHKGKEPVGFGFTGHFMMENVWEDQENFLLKVTFTKSDGGHFTTRKGEKRRGISHSKKDTNSKKETDVKSGDRFPLYAHIRDRKEEQVIVSFFAHNGESDSITRTNLKKSLVLLTRTKPETVSLQATSGSISSTGSDAKVKFIRKDQLIHRKFKWTNMEVESESILLPEMINEWNSVSELGRDHAVVISSSGWQNVTLRSRIYNEAYSKVHMTYNLRMVEEESSHETSEVTSAKSLNAAIKMIGDDYIEQEVSTLASPLQREKQVCHECRTLSAIVTEYEDFMTEKSAASVQAGIAYLKILDRIRSAGPGTSKQDMVKILTKYSSKNRHEMVASLLDIFAGSRTESSIAACFEFLNLPSNDDLDIAERFLTTLAGSCSTAAVQSLSTPVTSVPSHKFVVEDVLRLLNRDGAKWASSKIRWSSLLTLGSLLKSHNLMANRIKDGVDSIVKSDENMESNEIDAVKVSKSNSKVSNKVSTSNSDQEPDELTKEVIALIERELESCKDTECRVAILHSLGNAGHLKLSLETLEKYALDTNGKRESISAMKAIRDCLEDEVKVHPLDDTKLIYRLRVLVLKIVYDSNHETTSRIIAAEIIAKFLADEVLSQQLLQAIPGFGNNEMVTLMWKRALKLSSAKADPSNKNWLMQSTLFNGTSSAFTRNIGGTATMNATYGVAMELLSKGKLLKESSFDFLLGDQKNQQHILSVGLFARGLSSFAGGSSDGTLNGDEDESTMAGMSLKIMGMQLRPYTFFSSTSELMGHVWSGTASEPTTAYRGNLLMADHEDGIGLINGFMVEQRLRGVLSLDLSGEVQISLWNRNSHAVVRSKAAALMQGSQAIVTSDAGTSTAQLFAFGGSTSIDTTTDTDFYSTPFKMCVKMTQPEFVLRHNTRKYEQVDEEQVHRRIHRRNYLFPAKSYALHPKIQEVCQSLLKEEL